MTSAVVCGLAGFAPVAGMGLHYLQYCLGLRQLGVEVFYLEDNGWYPTVPGPAGDDGGTAYIVGWLEELFGAFGIEWAYADLNGTYHGSSGEHVRKRCASADLLLNVSGSHYPEEHHRAAGVLAYIDTDPAFLQVPLAQGDAYQRELLAAHDVLFTFAEAINEPWCRLPRGGFTWRPTRQPVYLPFWEEVPEEPGSVYTTVMNWASTGQVVHWEGEAWGQKDAEFPLIRDLPRATGLECELAVYASPDVLDGLRADGWRVVDPWPPTKTIWDFRDYVAASRGEITVCKQAFTRSRSGWFPERSANYMAAGRPVVCQDTGWTSVFGRAPEAGLLAFTTAREAEAKLLAVERDPGAHGRAARRLVAEIFDSATVLERLLSDAGLE